jgi:hypothetical protein
MVCNTTYMYILRLYSIKVWRSIYNLIFKKLFYCCVCGTAGGMGATRDTRNPPDPLDFDAHAYRNKVLPFPCRARGGHNQPRFQAHEKCYPTKAEESGPLVLTAKAPRFLTACTCTGTVLLSLPTLFEPAFCWWYSFSSECRLSQSSLPQCGALILKSCPVLSHGRSSPPLGGTAARCAYRKSQGSLVRTSLLPAGDVHSRRNAVSRLFSLGAPILNLTCAQSRSIHSTLWGIRRPVRKQETSKVPQFSISRAMTTAQCSIPIPSSLPARCGVELTGNPV